MVVGGDEEEGGAASLPARRIVELGAGTGLCGMMLAKATECEVEVTDLPALVGLMEDNVRRNFRGGAPPTTAADDDDEHPAPVTRDGNTARGTVSARTLRWGAEEDYGAVPYDVRSTMPSRWRVHCTRSADQTPEYTFPSRHGSTDRTRSSMRR